MDGDQIVKNKDLTPDFCSCTGFWKNKSHT
jgi:hypothetical protein